MEHVITLGVTVLVLILTLGLLLPTVIKVRRRGTANNNRPDGLYVISEPENGSEASFE